MHDFGGGIHDIISGFHAVQYHQKSAVYPHGRRNGCRNHVFQKFLRNEHIQFCPDGFENGIAYDWHDLRIIDYIRPSDKTDETLGKACQQEIQR